MSTSSHPQATPTLPLWAHWLDLATLLLLLDALAVAVFGGWRLTVLDVDLSVGSPWRLAVIAGLLAALRHGARPRPSLPARLRRWATRPFVSSAGAVAWSVGLSTRAAVLGLGLLAVFTVGFTEPPGFRVSDHELANLPARGRAEDFLRVASKGYEVDPSAEPSGAILPGVPALMRVAGTLLGASTRDVVDGQHRHRWRILWAGVGLSVGAFLWALVYLHRLTTALVGSQAAAPAVIVLASFPTAVLFGAVGTEGVLLLAALGAVEHARRGEWGRSALWGLLAGLSDVRGACLLATVALMARGSSAQDDPVSSRRRRRQRVARLFAALAPLVGFLLALAVMRASTGAWPPLQAEGRAWDAASWLDIVAVGLAVALLVPIGRRQGWSLALLVGGFLVIGVLSRDAAPAALIVVCFPLHIELAARLGQRHVRGWAVVSSGLQGWLAVLFYTARLGP